MLSEQEISLVAKGSDAAAMSALNQLESSESIGVFDFDGVVISRSEEIVYQIPPSSEERKYLASVAREINFDFSDFDTRYLRHIIFQFALEINGTACDPGPLIEVLRSLDGRRPYFILTARSAMPAVRRALDFLRAQNLSPTEIFFVGRVGKGQQLKLLDGEFPTRRLVYFDDSPRHSKNAGRMKSGKIDSFFVEWPEREINHAIEFYRDAMVNAFGGHRYWR